MVRLVVCAASALGLTTTKAPLIEAFRPESGELLVTLSAAPLPIEIVLMPLVLLIALRKLPTVVVTPPATLRAPTGSLTLVPLLVVPSESGFDDAPRFPPAATMTVPLLIAV